LLGIPVRLFYWNKSTSVSFQNKLDKEGGIAKVMLWAHHTHERSADEAKTEHQKDQMWCLIGYYFRHRD